MTDCDRVEAALGAYLDGELPEDEATRVAAHVGSCSACSASLRWRQELASRLEGTPPGRPPPGLRGEVLAAARRADRPGGRPLARTGRLRRLWRRILPTKGASMHALHSCPQCGAPVSVGEGRCPSCSVRLLDPMGGGLRAGPLALGLAVVVAFAAGVLVTDRLHQQNYRAISRPARLTPPSGRELQPEVSTAEGIDLDSPLWAMGEGLKANGELPEVVREVLPGVPSLAEDEVAAVVDAVEHPLWATLTALDPDHRTGFRYSPPELGASEERRRGPFVAPPRPVLAATGERPVVLWCRRALPGNLSLTAYVRMGHEEGGVTLLARADRRRLGDPRMPTTGWFLRYRASGEPGRATLALGRYGRVEQTVEVTRSGAWERLDLEVRGSTLKVRLGEMSFPPMTLGIRNEAPGEVFAGVVLDRAQLSDLHLGVEREVSSIEEVPASSIPPAPFSSLEAPRGRSACDRRFGPLVPSAPRPRHLRDVPREPLTIPSEAAGPDAVLPATLPGWEAEAGHPGRWTREGDAAFVHGEEVARLWRRLPPGARDVEVRLEVRPLERPATWARWETVRVVAFGDRPAVEECGDVWSWSDLGGVSGGLDLRAVRDGFGFPHLVGQLSSGSRGFGGFPEGDARVRKDWVPLRFRVRRGLAALWVDDRRIESGGFSDGLADVVRHDASPEETPWLALVLQHAGVRNVEVEVLPR